MSSLERSSTMSRASTLEETTPLLRSDDSAGEDQTPSKLLTKRTPIPKLQLGGEYSLLLAMKLRALSYSLV